MKRTKKLLGWLLLLLMNGGLGYLLYRFAPPLSIKLDAALRGTGPLILGIYLALVFVFTGIFWVQNKVAKWSGTGGSIVLASLCALLMGGAATVMLVHSWLSGAYSDTWSGLGFVVFVGIGAGCTGYAGVVSK